ERGTKRPGSEIEEVLTWLVVVPEPAEHSGLQSADVRCDQVNDPAEHQKTSHGREGRDRIGEVLDRVVQRDDVEARRRKSELFEATGCHAQAAGASLFRREGRDLHTLDVPARRFRLDQEVAQGATDVEETTATAIPVLDRPDAIAERAPVHIGIEEIVRVPALGVVGGVVLGVVDRGRRDWPGVLPHEAAAAALDDERAVDLEKLPGCAAGAERAPVGDLGRARRSANERVGGGADPEVRKRAHEGTVASAAASFDPCSGEASPGSPPMRSSTTL